jgi:hypothetical protein
MSKQEIDQEIDAEEELRQVARELRAVHYRLLGIAASLPPPAESAKGEMGPEEETDGAEGLRAVVECVLADRIRPAIADLVAAVEPRPVVTGI